jgi:predicted ATPase/DNA-binding SARP family transcriptional activator
LSELDLAFLGPTQITHRQWGVITLPNRKTLALLVYLAMESEGPHTREALLGLFWPELPTLSAQNNLRVIWAQLRQSLAEAENPVKSVPHLIGTRLDLRFNLFSDHYLDVTHFRELLEVCRTHEHASRLDCTECVGRLTQAIDLVRGEFLEGFSLGDCPDFEEWLFILRERLHLQIINTLEELAGYHERAKNPETAKKYVQRLLEFDPLHEPAHRQLMRLLAGAGQRSAALAQYETCRRLLADELGVALAPETILLAEQIRANAPTQMDEPLHNLSLALTRFIGRHEESSQLQEMLTQEKGRIVTLVGPGGVGKTRLSLQVAHALVNHFTNGVWLVELAGINDALVVPDAVASALKVSPDARRSLTRILGDYLRNKSLLLVMDNCEHLGEACAELIQKLCSAAPGLVVLSTSRNPLHLEGEQVVRLHPLPSPDSEAVKTLSAASALQYDAIQLFASRATQALLSFSVTDSNVTPIAQICQHLDGIPLAIELAAARTGFMPVEAISQRLDQRFRWLKSHYSGALPRQQTLRALIAWSYDLLNEQERSLFQRLSVFAGGWTLEAAEAICDEKDLCSDILGRLVDQSLVVFGYDPERKRYRMHETIHLFAREQLNISAKEADVVEKHARFYIRTVAMTVENQQGLSLLSRLQQLQEEHDNLRSAFEWALNHDGELVLEMVTNLGTELRFWELSGSFEEGRRWLQRVLEITTDSISPLRAKALLAAAELSSAISDFDYGLSCAVESQRIFSQLGDQCGEVDARLVFADLADFHGDYSNLETIIQDAMLIAGKIQYKTGMAKAGWMLGKLAFTNAEYGQATQYLLPSVALWRELDRPYELAMALNTLGASMLENHDYAAGNEVLLEVAEINQALGYRRGVALALHNLAGAALGLKEYTRARELLSESLRIRRELGVRRGYAYSFEDFARLAYEEKQDERAIRLLAAARALRELIGAPLDSSGVRAILENILTELRTKLGDMRFEMEWSKGWAMTTEQAIELALS